MNTLHRCSPGPPGSPEPDSSTLSTAATSTAKPSGGKCNRSDGDWMNVHRRNSTNFVAPPGPQRM